MYKHYVLIKEFSYKLKKGIIIVLLLNSITCYANLSQAVDHIFFTHNDHLGSASWITRYDGKPTQYIHYLPYGQLLANQMPSGYDERFKFIGKERDQESGYDCFGARFYISPFYHWMSVDPMVDKYLNISPYAYCRWNPVRNIDAWGLDVYRYDEETGDFLLYQKTTNNYDQVGKFKFNVRTGEYELRTNKAGNYKFYTNGNTNGRIAKGILRDRLNIKENGKMFITNKSIGLSVRDFHDFALLLDDIVGKEISGFIASSPYSEEKYIFFESYKYNTFNISGNKLRDFGTYNIIEHFHTHGQATSFEEATKISNHDKNWLKKAAPLYPNAQFLILHNYGQPIIYNK